MKILTPTRFLGLLALAISGPCLAFGYWTANIAKYPFLQIVVMGFGGIMGGLGALGLISPDED